jgi:hypothetical protein
VKPVLPGAMVMLSVHDSHLLHWKLFCSTSPEPRRPLTDPPTVYVDGLEEPPPHESSARTRISNEHHLARMAGRVFTDCSLPLVWSSGDLGSFSIGRGGPTHAAIAPLGPAPSQVHNGSV